MFSVLTDFSYARTRRQAVGFYLVYLGITILVSGAAALVFSHVTGDRTLETGAMVGNFVAIVLCLTVSIAVVYQKKDRSFRAVFLVLLSGTLAMFAGGLGGLIPAAYLTTLDSNDEEGRIV